jgi:hypothetical protein
MARRIWRNATSVHRSALGRGRARAGELLVGGEVLRGHLVEEVLELLHDLLGVLDLVLELDRGLRDDLVGGKDRRTRADGQGQRVGGARVDLQVAAVGAQ